MRKVFGYLFTIIALIGMGVGFVTLYQIEMRLLCSNPVPVRITDKKLLLVSERTRHYVARALYQYNVGTEMYVGEKVMPYDFSTPITEYLEGVIEPIQIGEMMTAYYNRNDPSDSFLRKAIPYPPYMILLGSMFLLINSLYMIMAPGKSKSEPVAASGGWYRYPAGNSNLEQMAKVTRIQAIVFTVVSVATFAHYFWHAMQPYGIWEISTVCAFLLIGSILWKQAMECKKQAEQFDDLYLELNAPNLNFDTEYTARIRQKARRKIELVSVDLGITAQKENIYGQELHQVWYENPSNATLEPKEEIKKEQAFTISQKKEIQYSGQIFWKLIARVVSKSGVQEWSFPVTVVTPESNEPK